jgi:hypothetical protein
MPDMETYTIPGATHFALWEHGISLQWIVFGSFAVMIYVPDSVGEVLYSPLGTTLWAIVGSTQTEMH